MGLTLSSEHLSFEDRFFKSVLLISLAGIIILLLYDGLITGNTVSIVLEGIALILILGFLYSIRQSKACLRQRLLFSAAVLLLANAGWITGGGISLVITTIYFLSFTLVVVIIETRVSPWLYLIFLVNLIVLFSLEYYFKFNLSPDFAVDKPNLIKYFIVFFLLVTFGTLGLVFVKRQYDRERVLLHGANDLLQEKSNEIEQQNDALKSSEDELNETIKRLGQQRTELVEIKETLEEKVDERTNELTSYL